MSSSTRTEGSTLSPGPCRVPPIVLILEFVKSRPAPFSLSSAPIPSSSAPSMRSNMLLQDQVLSVLEHMTSFVTSSSGWRGLGLLEVVLVFGTSLQVVAVSVVSLVMVVPKPESAMVLILPLVRTDLAEPRDLDETGRPFPDDRRLVGCRRLTFRCTGNVPGVPPMSDSNAVLGLKGGPWIGRRLQNGDTICV